jgi:lysophospholipase L1-like esterase
MLFVHDDKTAVMLHRAYNQVVREIAEDERITLLDLETDLDSLSEGKLESMFKEDGIHFTPDGVLEVADRIAQTIEVEVLESVTEPYPLQ